MQHNSDESVVVYAVLVGDASILTRALPNPDEEKSASKHLLFELKNTVPDLDIPVFDSDASAFYKSKKIYTSTAITICELTIPADKYHPVKKGFSKETVNTVKPEMLSYVTLITGFTARSKELNQGKSITVKKITDDRIEFTPEDHKIIHVMPKK
jgi:hypothetical protein